MIPESTLKLTPNEEANRASIAERINKQIARNRQDSRYTSYHWPRDEAEWWHNVDEWWADLLNIAATTGCALEAPLDALKDSRSAVVTLEEMRRKRDTELAHFFSHVWGAAPDHGRVHGWEGWDVLCDLCSESGVLFDGPPDDAPQAGLTT